MARKGYAARPPIDRFHDKYVVAADGCWLWQAATNGKYAKFYPGPGHPTTQVYAHRWIYAHTKGPIPEGFVINHLCEVPLCVNPEHLEAVTMRDNLMYSDTPTRRRSEQTHCIHGHPFDEVNTLYGPNQTRSCLTCKRLAMRKRRAGLHDGPPCAVDSCSGIAMSRGWCGFHYGRWWHYGDPLRGD